MTQQPRMAATASMTRPPGVAARAEGQQEIKDVRRRRRQARAAVIAAPRGLTLTCMKMISNEALLEEA